MAKDDRVYINQILDAVSKVESFVSDMNKDSFQADQKTQSAVIMQLILIGELAKKVSGQMKQRINLPWKDIMGLRDEAVHNYFAIDVSIIWSTIQGDIPELKKRLKDAIT